MDAGSPLKKNKTMKRPDVPSSRLPDHVQELFWDYDSEAIDWDDDRELIIRRVVAEGNWDAIKWLRDRLGDDSLRSWIVKHEGRGLSPRQLRFWEIVLELPSGQVDAWIAGRQHAIWDGRART